MRPVSKLPTYTALMFADLQNQQLFCFTNTVSSHQRIFEKGSLSNDVGDGNENGKKAIGLDKQNNYFARAARFFVHFFAVNARLRRETC